MGQSTVDGTKRAARLLGRRRSRHSVRIPDETAVKELGREHEIKSQLRELTEKVRRLREELRAESLHRRGPAEQPTADARSRPSIRRKQRTR
jgi:hypothetical protein